MTGLEDLGDVSIDSGEQTSSSDEEQSKTLVFHSYSNRGLEEPGPYKKLDSWEVLDDEQLDIAYDVSSEDGFLRKNIGRIPDYEDREEWYNHFQVVFAHFLAGRLNWDEFGYGLTVETEGPVPLMEFFAFTGKDIMKYLRENPENVLDLDSDELSELANQAREEQEEEEEEAEAAPADDD
jgi:hypothetical protein